MGSNSHDKYVFIFIKFHVSKCSFLIILCYFINSIYVNRSSHSLDMTISQIVDGSFFLSIHKDIRRGWSCFHRPCIAMQDSFGNCIGRVKYPLKLCSIEFLVLNHCNEVIYSIHSHIVSHIKDTKKIRYIFSSLNVVVYILCICLLDSQDGK